MATIGETTKDVKDKEAHLITAYVLRVSLERAPVTTAPIKTVTLRLDVDAQALAWWLDRINSNSAMRIMVLP